MAALAPLPTVQAARAQAGLDSAQQDLALLTGTPATDVLRAVLAAEGVALAGHEAHAVHHRPGVGVSVGHSVRCAGRDEPEYLVLSTAPVADPLPAGATRALVDDRTVTVWRFPRDPALPALAAATSLDAVAQRLGVPRAGLGIDLLGYRPLRRAVVRVRSTDGTRYLKVVRPATAGALVRRHTLLAAAGLPVAAARDLGDGLVELSEVTGRTLTDAVAVDGAQGVTPDAVTALLDRLPSAALGLRRRPSWTERLDHHAHAAAVALPDAAERVADLAARVAVLVASSDAGPVVPTHGDLHDANLLLTGGDVTGLLDVDTLGRGHRVDDLACLLAHLSVLAALAPDVHRDAPATTRRWLAAFDGAVDPVALRARTAAVVLTLVPGALAVPGAAWRFLATAEAWAQMAELSSTAPVPLMAPAEAGSSRTAGPQHPPA